MGIDIDRYPDVSDNDFTTFIDIKRVRLEKLGKIVRDRPTKRGYHFKIELPEPVDFWTSIDIRFWNGDDPRRIVFDILRWRAGGKITDVLFTKKTKIDRYSKKKHGSSNESAR